MDGEPGVHELLGQGWRYLALVDPCDVQGESVRTPLPGGAVVLEGGHAAFGGRAISAAENGRRMGKEEFSRAESFTILRYSQAQQRFLRKPFDDLREGFHHAPGCGVRWMVDDEAQLACQNVNEFRVPGGVGGAHDPYHARPVEGCEFQPPLIAEVDVRIVDRHPWHERQDPRLRGWQVHVQVATGDEGITTWGHRLAGCCAGVPFPEHPSVSAQLGPHGN